MDFEKEGTNEEERSYGTTGHKVHWKEKKGSILKLLSCAKI